MSQPANRFSKRTRYLMLLVLAVLVLAASGIYAYQAFARYQLRTSGPSDAAVTDSLPATDRIIFRNTAFGQGYGMIGAVNLAEPAGPRQIGQTACDRVYAASGVVSCLRTERGIPTTFRTLVLDTQGNQIEDWALAGVPSRTRVSPGGLVATTSFVTGHSYATDSFSTETTIKSVTGDDYGNLEDHAIIIDGQELTSIDRNVWGVSFVNEQEYYATVASGGNTWLVRGDISKKLMTSVRSNAECPSVSPDRKQVAYKKRRSGAGPVHWDIAVLDLRTEKEIVIQQSDGFDDQPEWLDNNTLLFGMPRPDTVGDSDVYKISTQPGALPELFIEHAWSPSVYTED